MKDLSNRLVRNQAKLWMLATVVLAVLVANVAATPAIGPRQWEYKTVVFQIRDGESPGAVQQRFSGILNQETLSGWEYAGPCAHSSGNGFGADYVVLRRRAQ